MRKALCFLLVLSSVARAQEHDHGGGGDVGSVHFPVSCNTEAQARMDRAVAMLHSFWFTEAHKTFESVVAADPGCGVAYWGAAVTEFGNPMGGGSGPQFQPVGLAEAKRALAIGARSARDSAYINAALALFDDHDKLNNRERLKLYEQALADLVQRFPADTEAQIFHAIAMVATASPTDMTFAQQKAAAAILMPLYLLQPNHPGLAHYIIHAFDSPALAQNALAAARQYAKIAPAAPHALHMPSHIFTRLGYWDESIEMNRRSMSLEPTPQSMSHAADYMVYAYLQKGMDDSAKAVIDRIGVSSVNIPANVAITISYNPLAMQARYALERDDWKGAAALPVIKTTPSAEAVTHFARGLGAARTGDVATAKSEVAALSSIVQELNNAHDPYWPIVIEPQRMAVDAWIAHAEGSHEHALMLASHAADKEESVEKHPVTPGPLIPARELYGDLLMLHGKPALALIEYQKVMTREPNRTRTLLHAVKAANMAGVPRIASKYAAQLNNLVSPKAKRFRNP